jgi:hypothetical protein
MCFRIYSEVQHRETPSKKLTDTFTAKSEYSYSGIFMNIYTETNSLTGLCFTGRFAFTYLFIYLAVPGFEFRAYTLGHSTFPFCVKYF